MQFPPTEQTFLGFYIYTHHNLEDARQTWNDNKVRRVLGGVWWGALTYSISLLPILSSMLMGE